jgi:hypothetical protein
LDFVPTDGLVYLSGPSDVQYVKCIDLLLRPPVITIFRIHLEHMQRTGRPITTYLQGKAIYFFCLCIVLLPYIQANTRCKTKGLKKYKITVHRQRDHEDCLMNIQVPGSWSLDCPSPLLQNIWPLLVNCINVSMSQETLYWNCLPS